MGQQLHFLKPPGPRDTSQRAAEKTPEVIARSRLFGYDYFDGDRKYGYGGYHHDERWLPIAAKMIDHYGLTEHSRVLDVGCAKGFLVDAFMYYGIHEAFGLDVSRYAITRCPDRVVGHLHEGTARVLPFPDNSFDLVSSINALHNLPKLQLLGALREIMRVSRGGTFVQVDSYNTPEQKAAFEDWVLTALFHDYPEGWLSLFERADYTGDYDWTIIPTGEHEHG